MKPKKSLGQNFLKSKDVVYKLVETAQIENETVLEIGPGKGALTTVLLGKTKVIAIEKDQRMVELLTEKFKDAIADGRLTLIHDDIIHPSKPLDLEDHGYKLVANIPYYITGEIIEQFLSSNTQPVSMSLLVQKEVAERMVGKVGESILSISLKVFGTPRYIQTVSKKAFSPSPSVDSAIIYIDNISKDNFKDVEEGHFFKVLKTGFRHKRKLLMKNLALEFEGVEDTFDKLSIDKKIRAEKLSVEEWLALAKALACREPHRSQSLE